jgi:hypothetical protein
MPTVASARPSLNAMHIQTAGRLGEFPESHGTPGKRIQTPSLPAILETYPPLAPRESHAEQGRNHR